MYNIIINFWFQEIPSELWFKKDSAFDITVYDRFNAIHQKAIHGELWSWREQPLGRLAEIIILDQFSRNIYRDSPMAFAYDGMALVLAEEAVSAKADETLELKQKAFLYMPFMHSESKKMHELAMKLYDIPGLEDHYDYELKHKAIIDRFDRYPHRNTVLGRQSSPEELAFLKTEGSNF